VGKVLERYGREIGPLLHKAEKEYIKARRTSVKIDAEPTDIRNRCLLNANADLYSDT
jgi:hypothetical protein